jgi:transcriptional regulator with XRE-family HTH domain
MNNIGKTIMRLRKEKNITQEQLAEKLNVTRQAVSNWENGKTQPDIDTIVKIAGIFEVEVEEIIYGGKRTMSEKTVVKSSTKSGIGFGAALAMVISYAEWGSIGWAIVHGLLNWVYVIYYVIRY